MKSAGWSWSKKDGSISGNVSGRKKNAKTENIFNKDVPVIH